MLTPVMLDNNKLNYYHFFFLYNNLFFKSLIVSGKKMKAFNIFVILKYSLKLEENYDPYYVFLISMMRLSPEFVLSALKLSGIIYWLPAPITLKKKVTLSVKWAIRLLKNSRGRRKWILLIKALKSSIYNKGPLMLEYKSYYTKGLVNRQMLQYFV